MPDPKCHGRLTKLLDERGPRLYATLSRLTQRGDTARELLQELFARLAESDGFATAADPAAYAWRAAINLCMEWRRKRQREASIDPAAIARQTAAFSPLDRLVRSEQISNVLDALKDVSELPRTCFVLRLIERQSYEQIAVQLGKTSHQVRGLCHAAVRQIRASFGDEIKEWNAFA